MEGCGRRRPSTGDRRGPTTTMTMTHIAAAFGAAVFVATAPAVGFAQLIVKPAPTAKVDQGGATKPVKPAQRDASSPKAETPGRPWTLQDAMPDHSASLRYYAPENTSEPGLGRVPLRPGAGTFGTPPKPRRRRTGCPTAGPFRAWTGVRVKRRPTLGCRCRSRPATRH